MRERVRTLYLHSNMQLKNAREHDFDVKLAAKFADLIIQDCIAVVSTVGLTNSDNKDIAWAIDRAVKSIKDRFDIT